MLESLNYQRQLLFLKKNIIVNFIEERNHSHETFKNEERLITKSELKKDGQNNNLYGKDKDIEDSIIYSHLTTIEKPNGKFHN